MFGVSLTSAKKWLDGDAFPDTFRIEGMSKKFNVRPDWLWTGAGHKRLPQGFFDAEAKLEDQGFLADDDLLDFIIPNTTTLIEGSDIEWQRLLQAWESATAEQKPRISAEMLALIRLLRDSIADTAAILGMQPAAGTTPRNQRIMDLFAKLNPDDAEKLLALGDSLAQLPDRKKGDA